MFVVHVHGNDGMQNSMSTNNTRKRIGKQSCLINTCELLYPLFAELTGLGVNNF
jgi:hypothetical protein